MSTIIRELQYALRRLRGTPGFTIAATLTLAIAIGATASVFGVVNGVLLKAFPYYQPDRVLTLWESNPELHMPQATVATGTYLDWAAQATSFSEVAAATTDLMQFMVIGTHDAERVHAMAVTPSYFDVLGVNPILGRRLT